MSVTPSIAQMMPQTRLYIERGLIFANFKDHFNDNNEFIKMYGRHCCKSIGAEFFFEEMVYAWCLLLETSLPA